MAVPCADSLTVNLRIPQMVLGLKARRGHGSAWHQDDAASVVTEDPSLKRLWREVKACYRVTGLKFLKRDSRRGDWCDPAAETPANWRCRNCGVISENSGSCGVQVAGAGETG